MAFGILEDASNPLPSGTTLLNDVNSQKAGRRVSQSTIVLSPRPSDSPSDPLNWSRARKELAFLVILLGACGTGVIGPLLVPGFQIIAVKFQITLSGVTLLNGSLVSHFSGQNYGFI